MRDLDKEVFMVDNRVMNLASYNELIYENPELTKRQKLDILYLKVGEHTTIEGIEIKRVIR